MKQTNLSIADVVVASIIGAGYSLGLLLFALSISIKYNTFIIGSLVVGIGILVPIIITEVKNGNI